MSKQIVVVGGAGAVGMSFVRLAEARGDRVAVLDLASALQAGGMQDRPLSHAIDVAQPASVQAAFGELAQAWDHADAFIYASGFSSVPPKLATDVADEEWSRIINVNLSGAFRTAVAASPLLLKGTSASMVLVSSSMAFGPVKGFAPYITSKAGLIGLTRALALEFAPRIRVNAIAPSAMRTAFLGGGISAGSAATQADWFVDDDFLPTIPMGRLAELEDCAASMAYLVDEGSAYMTGQVLHLNGGKMMR